MKDRNVEQPDLHLLIPAILTNAAEKDGNTAIN